MVGSVASYSKHTLGSSFSIACTGSQVLPDVSGCSGTAAPSQRVLAFGEAKYPPRRARVKPTAAPPAASLAREAGDDGLGPVAYERAATGLAQVGDRSRQGQGGAGKATRRSLTKLYRATTYCLYGWACAAQRWSKRHGCWY